LHNPISSAVFEILPTVTLKPGPGVTQGHWFWYQWKARVHIPISDQ